jgi:two-component system nitrate/nitrite response regulator NarL
MRSILIVAPTRCYREALLQALSGAEGLRAVAAAAATVGDVVGQVRELHPDAVLLDFPLWEAPRLVRSIEQLRPATKIIALSVPETAQDIIGWAQAGATTCITRETPLAELPLLIEGIICGEPIGSPRVASLLFQHVQTLRSSLAGNAGGPHLTDRELEVLQLVAHGRSNKEIAQALSIALPTVKNHLQRIFGKLGMRRRAEAAAWLGVYQPPED